MTAPAMDARAMRKIAEDAFADYMQTDDSVHALDAFVAVFEKAMSAARAKAYEECEAVCKRLAAEWQKDPKNIDPAVATAAVMCAEAIARKK